MTEQKETFTCPVCGQTVDENLREYHRNLEEWAVHTISQANPDWAGQEGASKAVEHYRRVILGGFPGAADQSDSPLIEAEAIEGKPAPDLAGGGGRPAVEKPLPSIESRIKPGKPRKRASQGGAAGRTGKTSSPRP